MHAFGEAVKRYKCSPPIIYIGERDYKTHLTPISVEIIEEAIHLKDIFQNQPQPFAAILCACTEELRLDTLPKVYRSW